MVTLPLYALIRRQMALLDMTYREATDPSRVDDLITASTLHRYSMPDCAAVPDERTILGIAFALDIEVVTVERSLQIPTSKHEFRLPPRADRLDAKEREAVLLFVDTILAAHSDRRRPKSPRQRLAARSAADPDHRAEALVGDARPGVHEP